MYNVSDIRQTSYDICNIMHESQFLLQQALKTNFFRGNSLNSWLQISSDTRPWNNRLC